MVVRTVLVTLCSMVFVVTASAEQKTAPIVFPKDKSIVGSRVNLVLDPTEVPFFQVIVGKTEYPVVDTSTGKHAFQGLELEPGLNTLTIKVFAPPPPEEKDTVKVAKSSDAKEASTGGDASKQKLLLLSTWERQVFSMRGIATVGIAPKGFNKEPFHSREHETGCSGCHELEAPPRGAALPKKPEDVICYACHRKIPTGKYIHGPAAVWNCLACHDPELYPVKYQFTSADPWKVAKTIQTVEPKAFTLSTAELFKPGTALIVSKEKAKDMFAVVLDFIKQNPLDKIRLEVHTDNTPPLRTKEKVKGKTLNSSYKTNLDLAKARAKALVSLLKESGVNVKNLTAAGLGDKLPKAPNKTPEGREQNNRVEIIVHPADLKVKNSQQLPVLKDRDRVLISLKYSQGPQVRKLTVIEKVSKGRKYVKGSGVVQGRAREPKLKGDELIWELGDREDNFSEALSYVVTKEKNAQPIPEQVAISFTAGAREQKREFESAAPSKQGMTIKETCLKCHEPILDKPYKHGPAVAGYCTLCHDPHASTERAWLRKPVWELCTACHAEKVTGSHRFVKNHPTQKKNDPMRPGKQLSCASCHDPHSAETDDLFAYDKKKSFEMCKLCHAKKFGNL